MGDRGRKSSQAEIAKAEAKRPKPPAYLNARDKRRWQELVDDYPAGHFRPADLELIAHHVCLERVAEDAYRTLDKASPAQRAKALREHRQAVAALESSGTKLRLYPSTRMRHERATVNKTGGKRPWER